MVAQSQKRKLILCAALCCLGALTLSAQSDGGQTDSLVRLLNARYIEQVETDGGETARKAIEATFLHNNTYLSCDTALWHVNEKIINCFGNVQLLQGESVLTSAKLDYKIDDNLAEFRGGIVELRNKQDNVLRTRILDYNTQDSLAVFRGGASMVGSDGQIIESDDGTYSNARNYFTFRGHVNMFTDSVFVRTEALDYDSAAEKADFLDEIDFWKDSRMLSAGRGWYQRGDEIFFFRQDVHGLDKSQESWSDTLYYYRRSGDVLMLGSVQIQDTPNRVAAMGDRLHYIDSLARVTLDQRASAAIWDEKEVDPDTTYLGATRFVYESVRKCDIPESEIKVAASRLEEMLGDPVMEYRRRVAQEAAQRAAEAAEDDFNAPPVNRSRPRGGLQSLGAGNRGGRVGQEEGEASPGELLPPERGQRLSEPETLPEATAVAPEPEEESGENPEPEPEEPVIDTTKVGFLFATGDIRIFRKDMQVRCDSLRYCDLDSIARLYKDPVVWNEGRRQYNSDSLFELVRQKRMERANLLSNAFIHTEEPGGYYDQIKATDVLAYFSDSTTLRRFDALGGVNALFYLEENEAIATVNRVETQMLMATMANGELERAFYYDSPRSDAYPVVQMPASEQRLRGFNWQPDRRPQDKYDVTAMVVRDSEREDYEARPHTDFRQTEVYFPGHMKEVYAALEAARAKRAAGGGSPDQPANDDVGANDDLTVKDDLGVNDGQAANDVLAAPGDSLSVGQDSLAVRSDTTNLLPPDNPAPSDTTYMSPHELKRALRIAARDARWAELDQRDADKAAAKQAKKAARKARRAERVAKAQARQDEIDAKKLQKFIEQYEQKKNRHEAGKQELDPAGERPPGVEDWGELSTVVESE